MFYTQEEVNLHTHSFYCRHGEGGISDYVKAAEQTGRIKVLGFSEHIPVADIRLPHRMNLDEMTIYMQDIIRARENTGLVLLTGAECDAVKSEFSFYKDELLGKRNFDYLGCSVHFNGDAHKGEYRYLTTKEDLSPQVLSGYVRQYTDALSSGIFLFGCHPDFFGVQMKRWNAETKAASIDILQCAKDCNIPLEINDYGNRKRLIDTPDGIRHQYPVRPFWELAKEIGVKVTTNSDAHSPEDVGGKRDSEYISGCYRLAAELGIKFVSWKIEDGKISVAD